MSTDRLETLRHRVKALKSAGWYDDFDLKRIGEWVKTMDLIEVETVVGWGEQDYRESRTVTPVLPFTKEAA